MPPAIPLLAPFAGIVMAVTREPGDRVSAGDALVVLEAMKMEHEIPATSDGVVRSVDVAVGDAVDEGQVLAAVIPGSPRTDRSREGATTVETPSDDLEAVNARHARTLDAARPDAVAKRHDSGRRTARENLDDLIDPGSFVEYGPLIFAAQ
ncbi:MAG: biotin carboxylase, partial [Solirubrobacterales bacterium]|nr:biotin carboxylase [Solirubrobacterales bacterium]